MASDCTSNVACLRALGYLRPQASTAALETWQQEPSSTLGMSKSLSASTSISLSKSKAALGRTRPVATPQVHTAPNHTVCSSVSLTRGAVYVV